MLGDLHAQRRQVEQPGTPKTHRPDHLSSYPADSSKAASSSSGVPQFSWLAWPGLRLGR